MVKPAKKESRMEKATRLAKEKKDAEQARAKVVKDHATARVQANSQNSATEKDRIPRKPMAKATPASGSGSEEDHDEGEQPHRPDNHDEKEEDDEEDDDWYALPTGDASCGQQQCGLGSATAKFNCKRHEKAARDQALSSEGPRELRHKKSRRPSRPRKNRRRSLTGRRTSTATSAWMRKSSKR